MPSCGSTEEIVAEFARRRRRQIIVTVLAVILLTLIFRYWDLLAALIGDRSFEFVFIEGAVIGAWFAYYLTNWRCPACGKNPWGELPFKHCPKCGGALSPDRILGRCQFCRRFHGTHFGIRFCTECGVKLR
jgi:hypothetical protein